MTMPDVLTISLTRGGKQVLSIDVEIDPQLGGELDLSLVRDVSMEPNPEIGWMETTLTGTGTIMLRARFTKELR